MLLYMIYQVMSPVVAVIDGDTYKEAIKNYIKMNYALTINSMIFKDQQNHYQARIKYYNENNKNKIGISVYPYTIPIVNIGPLISYN